MQCRALRACTCIRREPPGTCSRPRTCSGYCADPSRWSAGPGPPPARRRARGTSGQCGQPWSRAGKWRARQTCRSPVPGCRMNFFIILVHSPSPLSSKQSSFASALSSLDRSPTSRPPDCPSSSLARPAHCSPRPAQQVATQYSCQQDHSTRTYLVYIDHTVVHKHPSHHLICKVGGWAKTKAIFTLDTQLTIVMTCFLLQPWRPQALPSSDPRGGVLPRDSKLMQECSTNPPSG